MTVQANGMSSALSNAFNVPPIWGGLALAFVLGLVIFGGVKSISRVAAIVTPFMALGYVAFSLVVVCSHIEAVPAIFKLIITNAFGINPIAGGILGSTIMMGVKRGIFSNEAGQGGGAVVSASADVSHPVRQGLAQSFSVYVDTLLICTATAFMILICGTYNVLDSSTGEMLVANAPALGNNYVSYTQAAIDSVLPGVGGRFVSIALIFFVFTTIMAYYFYSESAVIYLLRRKGGARTEAISINAFRTALLAAVVFGAVKEADLIWMIGDIGVGLQAWINVIAVLLLCRQVFSSLRDYEKKMKN